MGRVRGRGKRNGVRMERKKWKEKGRDRNCVVIYKNKRTSPQKIASKENFFERFLLP